MINAPWAFSLKEMCPVEVEQRLDSNKFVPPSAALVESWNSSLS